MLCITDNKNEIYKELVSRLKAGESREALSREIEAVCEECRPLSPVICVDLCPIWKFKREFHESFQSPVKQDLTDILRITKNSRRLKILEAVIEEPYSLEDLREALKETGYNHSLTTLRNYYVKPLVDAGLLKVEDDLYEITTWGENAYNILTKSEVADLPIDFKGYDEKILDGLLSEPKSYNELAGIVPRGSLQRSLKRLQSRNLIAKSDLSGRVYYFKTKRRPTRKLSPTEMKIFKALPKEGISAKDLQEKVGVNIRRIYKYLRRLRYKRHVKKGEKIALYNITDAGRSLVQSLNVANNLIQARAE